MRKTLTIALFYLGSTVSAHEWGVLYTGESAHALSGGADQGHAYLGNLDVTAYWQDLNWFGLETNAFVYVLGNHGDSPSELIGDAQTFSNIDAPETIKLYEIWFEQLFAEGRASYKVGLIDLNSEFDVIDSAGVFQNSSFGIGPDFSQSGANGPSIFPTTSFGLRVATTLTENSYGQCIVLDGVPGDPNNEKGTHVHFDQDDGWLVNCEAGYRANAVEQPDGVSKLAIGVWRYSESVETVDGSTAEKNHGIYVLGEQTVWQHDDRRLDVFARIGVANDDVNQFDQYIGAGIVLTGVIAEDLSDQIGIGVARVQNGDAFIAAMHDLDVDFEQQETTLEMVYRYTVNDWLTVQPSVQYIKNPGMDPALDNATALAIRIEVGQSGEF